MFARLPARRAIAAGVVILFHLLLIFTLVEITGLPVIIDRGEETPIEMFFRALVQKQPEEPKTPPLLVPRPIYVPPVPPKPAVPPTPPESETKGIRGVGRYLFNCSGMFYEQLDKREWAHCLANQWDLPKDKEQAPVLAAPKPSPFDIVIQQRKKPAVPIERQCKLGQMNSNLGLPCYDFSGQ